MLTVGWGMGKGVVCRGYGCVVTEERMEIPVRGRQERYNLNAIGHHCNPNGPVLPRFAHTGYTGLSYRKEDPCLEADHSSSLKAEFNSSSV